MNQLILDIYEWILTLAHGSGAELHLILIVVDVCLMLVAVFLMANAKKKEQARVGNLINELDVTTQHLNQAERIGKFGSFSWYPQDPRRSVWSEGMYHLFDIQKMKKAPKLDIMFRYAHPQDKARVEETWNEAQKTNGPFKLNFRTVSLNGRVRFLHVEGKTSMTREKDPHLIEGVAQDVTKAMEVDKAKSEFVSLASHQLKTPLTSIRWLSEALIGGSMGELTENQKNYLGNIHDSVERMVHMINDLLNISRLESGPLEVRPEEFAFCEFVHAIASEQMHTIRTKELAWSCDCADSIGSVRIDKELFRMVFQNLLSNAVKYTPEKGMVSCSFSEGTLNDGVIEIVVKDSGIGIPVNEQERVFERLHRAKNASEQVPDGTGLGLYLVKSIVDNVGGTITFESKENEGTAFYISMPKVWQSAGSATSE